MIRSTEHQVVAETAAVSVGKPGTTHPPPLGATPSYCGSICNAQRPKLLTSDLIYTLNSLQEAEEGVLHCIHAPRSPTDVATRYLAMCRYFKTTLTAAPHLDEEREGRRHVLDGFVASLFAGSEGGGGGGGGSRGRRHLRRRRRSGRLGRFRSLDEVVPSSAEPYCRSFVVFTCIGFGENGQHGGGGNTLDTLGQQSARTATNDRKKTVGAYSCSPSAAALLRLPTWAGWGPSGY